MREKKIKRLFLEDVKKNFQPQTTFEDVYNRYLKATKDQPKNVANKKSYYNPFKIATLVTSILLVLCIVSLTIVSIKYINKSELINNEIPSDMRSFIEQNNQYYNNLCYDTLALDNKTKIIIIKGYNMDDENISNSKYYYLFKCPEQIEASLIINDKEISLHNNSYGIMASFDNDKELNKIAFSINYKGHNINYSLQK